MDFKRDFELSLMLENIRTPGEEERFIEEYAERREDLRFHEYLRQYIAERGLSMAEVMTGSRLNKNYGYNIVNGTRKCPGRDKVLALCIGAGMSFGECQSALKTAGHPLLDPLSERDIRIAVFINNGYRDVLKLNIKLEENGLEPLDV